MHKSPWIKGPSIGRPGSIVSSYIKRGNPSFGGSHEFASPLALIYKGEGSSTAPRSHGERGLGGGAPPSRPAAAGATRAASALPFPPWPLPSPPSPSPIPPCIQWSTLPQTSVPLYVNIIFDGIKYYFMIYVMFVSSFLSYGLIIEYL